MIPFENQDVAAAFRGYPGLIRQKLLFLRQLIYHTAVEADGVERVTESLKWGEPSYAAKGGSPVRIGWKESRPDHYAAYFHCQTALVETFRVLYGHTLRLEGNRAVVFHREDPIPEEELKHCFLLALTYHRRKHLPLLGV